MLEMNFAEPVDNKAYQAALGESLLASMDREDAIDFCINNEWVGVLARLLTAGSFS